MFRSYTAGAAAIPIGIAVGRQRLQETTANQILPHLQPKDLNRFSLGLADLGKSNRPLKGRGQQLIKNPLGYISAW